MTQLVLETGDLPASALDAAATFHSEHSGEARRLIANGCGSLVIVLPRAAYDHTDWRRATARDFARLAAPTRVNLIAGDEQAALDAAIAFLASAPGVTGQYLPVGGQGAEHAAD